ncbi:MAG: 3-isopropylmalate dehydratase [Bacillota bacterium]
MKTISGKALKYGDNINTDIISPGAYLQFSIEKQAEHAMEGIDEDFTTKVRFFDILVVGENFGSGSSRETAPLVLKANNVKAIVAKSFARIFYRNAINIGLPVVELETSSIDEGDELVVDVLTGKVENLTKEEEYQGVGIPSHVLKIIEDGGLKAYLKNKAKQ